MFSPNLRCRQKRPTLTSFRPHVECLEDRLVPAMLLVTTNLDPVTPIPGLLSLREAISEANAAPVTQTETIVLGTGTYKIAIAGTGENNNATGDFDITHAMTIEGQGAGTTTVDGGGLDRIFDVLGTINVTFTNMSLRHGAGQNDGGAIKALTANLHVTDCMLSDNSGLEGGAIDDENGNVTVIGSTVSRNVVENNGGGIRLGAGTLTLSSSTVRRNSAGGIGGGIEAATVIVNQNSIVSADSGAQGDGGIDAGTATLTNSTVNGNFGGGINADMATLTNCTVNDNFSPYYGGGIEATTLNATNCTVNDNSALYYGGAIYSGTPTLTGCTINGNSAGLDGGGICIFITSGSAGPAFVKGCTISDNTASLNGGGFYGFDTATFVNSTVSGNHAGATGSGTILGGGGILASTATLVNSTVSGNISAADGGGIWSTTANLTNSTMSGNAAVGVGGGIFTNDGQLLNDTIAENSAHQGGGVYQNATTPVSVKNTIIALNLVTFGGAGPDVNGAFNSQGHNLIGIFDSSAASGFTNGNNGDKVGAPSTPLLPGLSGLGNHGGPTETYALMAGSRAIDAGANDPLATLSANVTATATFFSVSSKTPFTPGMLLRLGGEVVRVVAVAGGLNALTVQRGVGGTTAAAHISGTGLLLGADQRGVLRPRDGNGDGTAAVDIGAFEL